MTSILVLMLQMMLWLMTMATMMRHDDVYVNVYVDVDVFAFGVDVCGSVCGCFWVC